MRFSRIVGRLPHLLGLALLAILPPMVNAQPPGNRPPAFVSPEVSAERHVTIRVHAPKAEAVRLDGGDMPGVAQPANFTKGENGVWEGKFGPVPAGTYRYRINVDDVNVIDPRNPLTSQSNSNTWSLVNVPGSDFQDLADVPHGAVAAVNYNSKALGKFRRMHIYTPPGYENGTESYPVFYLLHGASDCDQSWSTVGRAGIILDNLIAAKKAKPMIVVMPDGHTQSFSFDRPRPQPGTAQRSPTDEFVDDFNQDIMPYVESHYRTINDRAHRAIAGLSMGGAQTIAVAVPQLDKFAHFGVYSSGVFGINGGGGNPFGAGGETWEERHKAVLDDAKLKEGLKLVWFATGKEDFLLETTRATVEVFKKHGFNVEYNETDGGHTWLKWRDYLNEFAPKLFQ